MRNLLAILAISSAFVATEGYFITIDAHAEECFFEKVTTGTKLGERREKKNKSGFRLGLGVTDVGIISPPILIDFEVW